MAQRLGRETYQRPDDIAQARLALAMVGVTKIWSAAFPDASSIKIALGLIVDRRNRIVHSCDLDPLLSGEVTPLSADDALNAILTMEGIVAAIDEVLTTAIGGV